IDWLVAIAMLIASLIMIGFGIYHVGRDFQSTVLLVFGIIGCFSSWADLRVYHSHSAVGKARIVQHLTAMLGATIAALTAFSVTNFSVEPEIILWLTPTIIFFPIIYWWKHRVLNT